MYRAGPVPPGTGRTDLVPTGFMNPGPRYAICIFAAMAAMDAKLGYNCAKQRRFSAAIALALAQCCNCDLLDN
jgi:hypothetical protein